MSQVMEEEIKRWTARRKVGAGAGDHPGQDDGGGGQPISSKQSRKKKPAH
jgi:hypothetical protein